MGCSEHFQRKHTNFLRYNRLFEYGCRLLRRRLLEYIHPQSLPDWADDHQNHIRQTLKGPQKRIRQKLLPEHGHAKLDDFDMTLLVNVCTKLLGDGIDATFKDDVAQLGKLRNEPSLAHNPRCELLDTDFEMKWGEAASILLRLGAEKDNIDSLKIAMISG